MRYESHGPAVMLGESTSYFPSQLAAYWRSKGIDVVLITHRRDAIPALPDGTPIINSSDHETPAARFFNQRALGPVLYQFEKLVPRFKQRFTRITGVSPDTELWLPYFADFVKAAWPTSRAALAQRPRFVFGHEVTTYGLATALCHGVPKILFPWGGDVFTYAESSPFHFALTKFALHSVDLIVPSSTTSAQHISERFGISRKKIESVSWGVDRNIFRKADPEKKRTICAKWRIEPDASIVLNPRRFRPDWGAFVALEAFFQIAAEHAKTHFVMFGGKDTEVFTKQAQTRIDEKGLSSRFTLLDGDAPIDVCAELMSISDIFVSLLGRGDMRSASVLQSVASGAVPIISDQPEYRVMEELGFAALFVKPESVEDVVEALRLVIRDPSKAQQIIKGNFNYISEHENHQTQMDMMLSLIEEVCSRY